MKIKYRDKLQPVDKAATLDFEGKNSLEQIPKGKIIFWDDIDALACLDIDFHGSNKPENVLERVKRVYPQCDYYDVSKRGGLHLYYTKKYGLTAAELASLAYFSAQRVYQTCTGIEVLSKTRIVNDIYEIDERERRVLDVNKVFDSFGRDVSESALDAVYDRFGIQRGESKRVSSNLCPFTNHRITHDVNPSVQASDRGIYCFRCGKGTSLEALATETTPTQLYRYVKNLLWWDLAELYLLRFVRHDLKPLHLEKTSKLAYSGLLSLLHSGDYRRLWALERIYLYRDENNTWLSPNGVAYKDSEAKALVKLIPMLNTGGYDSKDQPLKRGRSLNQTLLQVFSTPGEDLSEYIPKTVVTQGVNVAFSNIVADDTTLLRKYFTRAAYEYYSPASVVTDSDALQALDTISQALNVYPKGHKLYEPLPAKNVAQIIYAMLYTEYAGEKPILVATGVSGGGKTLIPLLCNAIVRGKIVLCPINIKSDQRNEAFGAAIYSGARCFIHDEALKNTSPNEFLNMNNSENSYRIMYLGFQTIRNRCCSIITGITLPKEYKENGQFMRRVTLLPALTSFKNWNGSIVDAGLLKTPELKQAADDLLAYFAQYLPSKENVGSFRDFWASLEPVLHPEFLGDDEPRDGDTDDYKNSSTDRAESIRRFLCLALESCQPCKAAKYKKGVYFPKNQSSRAWAWMQNTFLGLDISARLPSEVLDYFSEYDLSAAFDKKNFTIEIAATRDNIIIRLRSGHKLLDYYNDVGLSVLVEK